MEDGPGPTAKQGRREGCAFQPRLDGGGKEVKTDIALQVAVQGNRFGTVHWGGMKGNPRQFTHGVQSKA